MTNTDTGSPDDYLTYEQAAELLQVGERTIRRAVERGEIPVIKIGPRTVRIRRADLDALATPKQASP